MSEHMKKRLIKAGAKSDVRNIFCISETGLVYRLPVCVAERLSQYRVKGHKTLERAKNKIQDSLSQTKEEVFSSHYQAYTKPGVLLQGIRHREGMTQKEFAKLIQVTQADLSKMENGKRPIGKTLAKRIASRFNLEANSLLSVE